MIPIVPVPNFLLMWIPDLGHTHQIAAYWGGLVFFCYSLYTFMMYIPISPREVPNPWEVDQIKAGGIGILIAIAFLLFGIYPLALAVATIIICILWKLIRAGAILRSLALRSLKK